MDVDRWWNWVVGLVGRARHEIVGRDLSAAPASTLLVLLPLRVGVHVWHGIRSHQLFIRAAALTYVTLVSLVPTLAVAFAMFKAFGGLDTAKAQLIPKLLDYIAVGSQSIVEARIEEVLANIHGGAIGGVGTVFLLGSVVFLLSGMEDAFNKIWEAPRPRSLFRRITVYWTLVTITPTLLMLGLTLPTTLGRIAPVVWAPEQIGAFGVLVSLVLPLVFIWLGFSLLYFFVPNARVAPNAAVIGAMVGGTLWWGAVHAWTNLSGMAIAYSKIYGSLGVLLVFLFWVFLTWLIVLGGGEVAASVQHVAWTPAVAEPQQVSQSTRELLALRVMAAVARRFRDGDAPATITHLCAEVHAPGTLTAHAVHQLRTAGLLGDVGTEGRLVPLRDPACTSPADVLHALRHCGEHAIWDRDDPTTRALARWQEDVDRAAADAAPRISVLDLAVARS
jgi:membrane protein